MWKTVRVCRCTLYTRCIVNERWPCLSGWFVQDDVSVGRRGWGWGSMQRMRWHIPDSPHTAPGTAGTSGTSAAGHSPLHCGSSPGLQKRHRRTCMHTHTHTTHNSQCNYSQNRILQACCSANREAAFVMQQKRDALDSSFISASKKHQTFGEDRFILKCAEILNLKKCSPKIETLYKLPARNKWFSCLSKWKPLQSSTCSWGNKLFCVSHNACLAEWYTR